MLCKLVYIRVDFVCVGVIWLLFSDLLSLTFSRILRFLFGHFLKRKLLCDGRSRPGAEVWEPGACRVPAAVWGTGLISLQGVGSQQEMMKCAGRIRLGAGGQTYQQGRKEAGTEADLQSETAEAGVWQRNVSVLFTIFPLRETFLRAEFSLNFFFFWELDLTEILPFKHS